MKKIAAIFKSKTIWLALGAHTAYLMAFLVFVELVFYVIGKEVMYGDLKGNFLEFLYITIACIAFSLVVVILMACFDLIDIIEEDE